MNKAYALRQLANLNKAVGIDPGQIVWDTPGAYLLESCQPGTKRIYHVELNMSRGEGSRRVFTGSIREVCGFLDGANHIAWIDYSPPE